MPDFVGNKRNFQLSFGAITNEYLIKRELELQGISDGRVAEDINGLPKKRRKDVHLDADRRLMAFSYTPDTFALLIAPMIRDKWVCLVVCLLSFIISLVMRDVSEAISCFIFQVSIIQNVSNPWSLTLP